MRYAAYIHSPAWDAKRQEAFEYYGERCAACSLTYDLRVHHRRYDRLGDEDVATDLVVLCEKCHDAVHRYCKVHGVSISDGTDDFILGFSERETRSVEVVAPAVRAEVPRKSPLVPAQKERVMRAGTAKVDIEKMMAMYGIDEETARSVVGF